MLNIRVESKFSISKGCGGRNIPRVDGAFYVFSVTDEEYMFWQGLEAEEQRQFVDSMSGRCFHDTLVEFMRIKRPENYLEDRPSNDETV